MRAHGRHEARPASQPTTKRSCRCADARGGIALTGCSGLPVTNASTSSVFHANTRSAGVRPGSPHRRRSRGRPARRDRCRRARARTAAGIGGGRSASTRMRPRASTIDAIACARIVPGLASRPPQLPEWWPPRAGRRSRSKLNAPREPRNSVGCSARRRGPSEAIRTSAASASRSATQTSRRPGEPVSSPVSSSTLTLKPRRPRASMHALERGQVDRVLALVVGGAAAVPAIAVGR